MLDSPFSCSNSIVWFCGIAIFILVFQFVRPKVWAKPFAIVGICLMMVNFAAFGQIPLRYAFADKLELCRPYGL